MLEDTFYYELANDDCGILEKGVRLVYKRKDGKYMLRSLSNNYEEEAPNCDLKYLLIARQKRFNILDNVAQEALASPCPPVFLRRVQRMEEGWVVKLSNQMVQLLIDASSYLSWGKRVWEVSASKEKELSVVKLRKGTLKGNG